MSCISSGQPCQPAPRPSTGEVLAQGLEGRKALQRRALGRAISIEIVIGAAAAERLVQHGALQCRNAGVVDQLGLAQAHGVGLPLACVVAADDLVDGDIDRIEVLAARRRIGTGALGIGGEQRMQRIDADEVGALRGEQLGELRQILEVADAEVAAPNAPRIAAARCPRRGRAAAIRG